MDPQVEAFLEARKLAVVGVSRSEKKFGSVIYKELKERGFDVYGVNPQMETVFGDPCFPSIASVAEMVDGVVICIPPQQAAVVVREAADAGLKRIWLQQGSQSLETRKAAEAAGVTPVEGKCIMMYAGEVTSIHAVHRFFARLFGQY